MLEKIVACAYCRVSTKEDNQLNSLENQTFYFNEQAEKSNKYTLYRIYADEGLSATSWKKRRYFKDMLYDAGLDIEIHRKEIKAYVSDRTPKFNRILVKDVSRFSRNASEGLELVTKLREKNVHIDFISLGLSTEQMTNDMIIGFFLLAAENESKDRSVKTKWGKDVSAKKGVINTSDNFFGYKYIKENNTLEVIESEAMIVKEIYRLYVEENYGMRRILNYLEANKMYTRLGKPFVQQSVRRILLNPSYTGMLARNRLDAPQVFSSKTYATLRPRDEWIITENRIPRVVEPEIYEKAQEIRMNKVNHKKNVGLNRGKSEYAGLIYCSICGENYISNKDHRSQKHFYICKTKKYKGTKRCFSVNVYKEQIDLFLDNLSEQGYYNSVINDRDEYINIINGKISELQLKINNQNAEEIKILLNERETLYEENKRLGILFIKGNLREEDLNEFQTEINRKIQDISKEISIKSMDNNDIYKKINELNECKEKLVQITQKDKYTKDDIKRQIIKMIISRNPEQLNQPIIEVKFKIFDVMKGIAEKYYD